MGNVPKEGLRVSGVNLSLSVDGEDNIDSLNSHLTSRYTTTRSRCAATSPITTPRAVFVNFSQFPSALFL